MLSREPVVLRQPLETESTEPLTELDNELLAKHKEYRYMPDKMTWDPNCYECKVRYRDPKAKDLVMYLHAWRYKVIYKLLFRLITCFSYILMISLDHQNKMADYLINRPFCSDDFIRSYKIIRIYKII